MCSVYYQKTVCNFDRVQHLDETVNITQDLVIHSLGKVSILHMAHKYHIFSQAYATGVPILLCLLSF